MDAYDSRSYWLDRGRRYFREDHKSGFRVRLRLAAQERHVHRTLRSLSFKSFLDVGCGYGRHTRRLHDAFPQASFVGIDLSEDQIARAQAYVGEHRKRASFRQGSIFELPFEDRAFDFTFASDVLMHLPPGEVEKAIAELTRVARVGVVNVDWHDPRDVVRSRGEETPAAGGYCFMHDYPSLYLATPAVQSVASRWLGPYLRQSIHVARVNHPQKR